MNVEEEKTTDDILAKRGFESGAGVNLGNFFVSEIEESESTPSETEETPAEA